MSLQPEGPPPAISEAPSQSLAGRCVAVFARPASAWTGLTERSLWWFPLLVTSLLQVAVMLPLYDRAYLPTTYEQLDAQIASGALDPAGAAKVEQFMQRPVMRAIVPCVFGVAHAVFTFAMALLIWFGVSFVLGAKFRYRLALEVAAWSGLVLIPYHLAYFAVAWSQETMKGIYFGLAAFLPEADPPAKWHAMLTVLLEWFGPFNIWFVAVAVVGCSALSGAPRRSVAWVLGGLAVALAVVFALLSGCQSPSP